MIDLAGTPRGVLRVTLLRDGRVIEDIARPNLIVGGAALIQSLLVGGSGSGKTVTKIGFGTSIAPAAAANTALSSPFVKALDGVSFPADGQVAFAFSLASGEALGLAIAEYGLLTTDSTLFARQVRLAPMLKDSSLTLSAIWTITF